MVELKARLVRSYLKTTLRCAKYAPSDRDAFRNALSRMDIEARMTPAPLKNTGESEGE